METIIFEEAMMISEQIIFFRILVIDGSKIKSCLVKSKVYEKSNAISLNLCPHCESQIKTDETSGSLQFHRAHFLEY